MAESLFTKVWALDFAAHRWAVEGEAEPRGFTSANVKFVALALARSSLHSGACLTSQKKLAVVTGVSKQTVGRCIAELESCGWLSRVERFRDDGARTTDKLWLTLPEVILAAETVPARPHRFFPGADNEGDGDGTPDTAVGGDATPRPAGAPPKGQQQDMGSSVGKKDSKTGVCAPEGPEVQVAVETIWAVISKAAKERTTKHDVGLALAAALNRGHAMEAVLRGVGAYLRTDTASKDDGAFQMGTHRVIAADRWQSYLAEDPGAPALQAPRAAAAPAAAGDQVEPWKLRLDLLGQTGKWDPSYGPRPGAVGCRVPADLQRAAGHVPVEDAQEAISKALGQPVTLVAAEEPAQDLGGDDAAFD